MTNTPPDPQLPDPVQPAPPAATPPQYAAPQPPVASAPVAPAPVAPPAHWQPPQAAQPMPPSVQPPVQPQQQMPPVQPMQPPVQPPAPHTQYTQAFPPPAAAQRAPGYPQGQPLGQPMGQPQAQPFAQPGQPPVYPGQPGVPTPGYGQQPSYPAPGYGQQPPAPHFAQAPGYPGQPGAPGYPGYGPAAMVTPGPGEPFDGAAHPDDLTRPLYGATIGQALSRFFKNYASFSGRASRSEFWWVALVFGGGWFVLSLIVNLADGMTYSMSYGTSSALQGFAGLIMIVVGLGIVIPSWAISWRRLHDANLAGPLALLSFVPIVGGIITLVLTILPPKVEGRRFFRNM